MHVFISWSGEPSRSLAHILKTWIENIFQDVQVFFSAADLDPGAFWTSDVLKQFDDLGFAICCVTPENMSSPWLNFEAGAATSQLKRERVCPILYGLSGGDLVAPLNIFQALTAEKGDLKRLVGRLNNLRASSFSTDKLDQQFEVWWPSLEQQLGKIAKPSAPIKRKTDDKIDEILQIVRSQRSIMSKVSRQVDETASRNPYLSRSIFGGNAGEGSFIARIRKRSPDIASLHSALGSSLEIEDIAEVEAPTEAGSDQNSDPES